MSRSVLLRGLVFAVAMSVVGVARFSSAQTRADAATAQALFEEGRKLMVKGDYAEACPKFEESQRVDPGSGTLLNLGICYEHQGRLASAWTTLLEAASASKLIGNAMRENAARQRAASLAGRLGRVTIRVTAKSTALEIARDGAVVKPAQWGAPIPTDAGPHTVVATAPGYKAWQTTITLKDGVTETIVVPELQVATRAAVEAQKVNGSKGSTKPATSATSSTEVDERPFGAQRAVAFVAGGVGLAGVAVGTVFGLKSMAAHDASQAPGVCVGGDCLTDDGMVLTERARSAGNVSTIAFAVGAAGLVAGTVLWFTAPSRGPQIAVGLGTVQLRGTF